MERNYRILLYQDLLNNLSVCTSLRTVLFLARSSQQVTIPRVEFRREKENYLLRSYYYYWTITTNIPTNTTTILLLPLLSILSSITTILLLLLLFFLLLLLQGSRGWDTMPKKTNKTHVAWLLGLHRGSYMVKGLGSRV